MTTRAPRSLRDLLQTLPQELYDEIFEQTFTADTGIRKLNTATQKRVLYKSSSGTVWWRKECVHSNVAVFPALLHVSRSTRAQFAKSYYSQGAFVAVHGRELVPKWAETLPPDHRLLLAEICVVTRKHSAKHAARARRIQERYLQDCSEHLGLEIGVVDVIATKLGVPVKKLVDILGL